jgi:Cu/Ag efflux protein CusF
VSESVDIERVLALKLAENDLAHLERTLAAAVDEANKAVAKCKRIEAEISKAKARHDRIADGGPIKDDE